VILVAKQFKQITLDPKKCRTQIAEFGVLLKSKASLSEKDDIQPFFKQRPQISALIGSYMRDIGPATDYAFEYPFYGDFAADLVVGDKSGRRFCVIEFEDGRNDSIFKVPKAKSTTEWSQRFEHGFSQIVDWFTLLDDLKKTSRFQKDFGRNHIRFSALLVIGRDAGVTDYDRIRLDWRTEKVRVDSHPVECVTFDGLHEHMDRHLKLNTGY
jgi:Domain of unknown function (DUF4263)